MDKDRIKLVIRVLSIIVYASAGIYMLVRAFYWFHKWDLPLWQWIAVVVVLPITTIIVPFYAGFTEGDWSMVGVQGARGSVLKEHKEHGGPRSTGVRYRLESQDCGLQN
jgi:hypothetical protein